MLGSRASSVGVPTKSSLVSQASSIAYQTAEEEEQEEDDDDVPEEEDQFGRLAYLAKCRELGVVPVSQILKFLENEEMHLTHYGLGQKGTMALISALRINQSITTLRLTFNNIPDGALAMLVDCLVDNHAVVELDVSGNRGGPASFKAMAALLGTRTCALQTLVLTNMHVSDKDGVRLALGLESNMTLKNVDLSHNDLGDRTAAAFGTMLAVNITLQELCLSWNKIRAKGVAAIAEGLKSNLTLQVLGLSWCGTGDAGAEALGAMLKVNHGLVDLDVCGNTISKDGGVALAAGIAASASLAAVAIDNNDLREEGGRAMLAAVQANEGIVILRMDNTNCSPEVRTAVDALTAPRLAAQRAHQLVL